MAHRREPAPRARRRPGRAVRGEDIVPGCRVVAVLGGGALTEVVLAAAGDGDLVVKAARPGREDQARRSLASEAELLGGLELPGLPRLLGADLDGDVPHLRIEHVDGLRLSTKVRREGPLDAGAAVAVAHDIAATLAAMHAAGVVHLDVKPGNIVLGVPPHLVDLGGARTLEAAARTRKPVGTRRWMAPEQRDPEAFGGMGPESDVWGIAATLHHALVGHGPFDDLAVAREPDRDGRERRDYPVTPRAVSELRVPDAVPGDLGRLLRACLAWDPDDRPRMLEVVGALSP